MAFSAKTLSFFFLTALISSLQVQIQARESKFFYKFTHISTKNKVIPESTISLAPTPALAPAPTPEAVPTIAAEPAPAPAPAEAPASFYAESGSGYGLYGRGSDQFPPTKESVTAAADENVLFNEELSSENYETGYQNNNHNNYGYTSKYNNNAYTSGYKSNGYVTEKQGMSDTRFMQNYQNTNNNNNYNNYNNAYASNYKNNAYTSSRGYTGNNYYNTNGYENEKQGMSDTRFLENGKYYYDVQNENSYFPAGFESEKGTTTSRGYYGNTQNVNEFSTMEQFENQQEYQGSPEEYVPWTLVMIVKQRK